MPEQKEARGLLATLAITAGVVALGAYALDLHAHTCANCGHKWRHLGAFNLGDEESHTCTRCGHVQWWKGGTPHVLRGSQFVASPALPEAPTLPSFDRGAERMPPSPVYGRTSPSLPYERMAYENSSFGTAYDETPSLPCESYEQRMPSRAYEEAPYRVYARPSPGREAYARPSPGRILEEGPPYRAFARLAPGRTYEEAPPYRAYARPSPSRMYDRELPSLPYEGPAPRRRAYQRTSLSGEYERHPPSRTYASLMPGTGDQEGCR